MKKLLLTVAKDKVAVVLQQYTGAIKQLEDRPTNLDAFAKYQVGYQQIQKEWEAMDLAKQEVEDIYLTLRQYQVRVPSDDDLERDKLMQKAHDFEEEQLPSAMEHIKAEKEAEMNSTSRRRR